MKKNYDVLVVGGGVWEVRGRGRGAPPQCAKRAEGIRAPKARVFCPENQKSGRTIKLKI